MHYMVEPPRSYTPIVNFTIAGEGVAALVLAMMVILCAMSCNKASPHDGGLQQDKPIELRPLTDHHHGEEEEVEAAEERQKHQDAHTHVRRRSGGGSDRNMLSVL